MQLNTSTRGLLALSVLIHLNTALPFFHRETLPLEALIRRATYSVVPVDGGAAQTDAPEETVVQTIVRTQPARTKTVIQTDNVTPIITTTISTPIETQTVVVVVTPIPTVLTTISYSIIDVLTPSPSSAQSTIVLSTADVPRPASSSPMPTLSEILSSLAPSTIIEASIIPTTNSPSTSVQPAPSSTPSAEPVSTPTSTEPSSILPLASSTTSSTSSATSTVETTPSPPSISSTITTTSAASSPTIISASISTTKTFDDGLWKTYYPAWNDTRTVGAYIRAVRTVPTAVALS